MKTPYQWLINLNKKRGIRFCAESKYNSKTKRYDLPEWAFISSENIIVKLSSLDDNYPCQLAFVNKIHTGCMGDDATVTLINGKKVRVDELSLKPASFLETLYFLHTPLYKQITQGLAS